MPAALFRCRAYAPAHCCICLLPNHRRPAPLGCRTAGMLPCCSAPHRTARRSCPNALAQRSGGGSSCCCCSVQVLPPRLLGSTRRTTSSSSRMIPAGVAWQPASRHLRPVRPMASSAAACHRIGQWGPRPIPGHRGLHRTMRLQCRATTTLLCSCCVGLLALHIQKRVQRRNLRNVRVAATRCVGHALARAVRRCGRPS